MHKNVTVYFERQETKLPSKKGKNRVAHTMFVLKKTQRQFQ
jgi:hypothetical protein